MSFSKKNKKLLNKYLWKSEENKNYHMNNKVIIYIYFKNGLIKLMEKKEIL